MKMKHIKTEAAAVNQVAQHTPTPWQYDGTRVTFQKHAYSYRFDIAGCFRDVGLEESKANAEFIVRACNCHDELVRELQNVLEHCEIMFHYDDTGATVTTWTSKDGIANPGTPANCDSLRTAVAQARAALNKATR